MLATLPIKVKPFFERYLLIFTAIIGSFLASYLVLLHRQPFNVDGILYLKAATVFLQSGWHAAMAVYAWPFYSILIAFFSQSTGLSLQNTALVINVILNTITVLAFIGLTKEFGGSRRVQYWALLVILIYPYFDHDRDNILRDFGYYAFLLVSLRFFIRYLHSVSWRHALGWIVSLVIATLFRIEGGILLLAMPFAAWFMSAFTWRTRTIAFFKLYAVHIVCLLVVSIWLLLELQQPSHLHWNNWGRVNDLWGYFYYGPQAIVQNFAAKVTVLKQSVFATNPFISVPAFLVGGIVGILVNSFLSTLGFIYLIFVAYAFCERAMPFAKHAAVAWKNYLILNIVIVLVFVLLQFFLAERYIVPLCLLLLLTVPFALEKLYVDWRQQMARKKWLFPFACFLLLINAVSAFGYFGPSKTYLIDAGEWLNKNTLTSSKVLTNNTAVMYYAHREQTLLWENTIKPEQLVSYDYMALRLDSKQTAVVRYWVKTLKRQPIAVFHNKRGDQAVIFQLKASSTREGAN